MKVIGFILIVIGIVMFVQRSVEYNKKEKVVDTNSIEITKKEPKMITWPYYAGAIASAARIILVIVDERKKRIADRQKNNVFRIMLL